MSRKGTYYTLVVKYGADKQTGEGTSNWIPEFGSYERAEVDEEAETYEDQGDNGIRTMVLSSSSDQPSINRAIDAANQDSAPIAGDDEMDGAIVDRRKDTRVALREAIRRVQKSSLPGWLAREIVRAIRQPNGQELGPEEIEEMLHPGVPFPDFSHASANGLLCRACDGPCRYGTEMSLLPRDVS